MTLRDHAQTLADAKGCPVWVVTPRDHRQPFITAKPEDIPSGYIAISKLLPTGYRSRWTPNTLAS